MNHPKSISKGVVVWLTGLSGSGKTTIAEALKRKLDKEGMNVSILDGDAVRGKHTRPLGFSREDIRENNRLIAKLACEESDSYDVVLVPVIAPYQEDRAQNRAIIGKRYVEVFVDAPLSVVEARDIKGHYKKARKGEIPNFIGVSSKNPYERPLHPDVVIDTNTMTIEEGAEAVMCYIKKEKIYEQECH